MERDRVGEIRIVVFYAEYWIQKCMQHISEDFFPNTRRRFTLKQITFSSANPQAYLSPFPPPNPFLNCVRKCANLSSYIWVNPGRLATAETD